MVSREQAGQSAQTVLIDGRRLRVTNLAKVVYPETGTTKGEVIAYYTRVAPALLPHVRGRPVTRKRWVDGVGTADAPQQAFFAKQLEPGAPDWVRRMPIEHSDGPKEYPLADDVATLAWFAQVAALELHVPQWRFTHSGGRARPDRLVLDLDPGPGVGLAECAEVARIARDILSGMGLEPLPVTSGSKGIHLYARLPTADDGTGLQSSDEVSAVAKELARLIEADHPELATHVMAKSARGGRVFIDWSQNSASKTTIAPYSLRGRARPWAAAPRTWDELDDPQLRQLEFEEVLERVDAGIDPLAQLAPPSPALSSYLAKRDAGKTPEPMPRAASAAAAPSVAGATRFVVQEHHARRLHYDLRIERDGVLISWAVPKGIPETVERNHLAVMTEPHPLEYLAFEGEIPKGEYGAGSMTVWDAGTVQLEKWRDDEVIGTFTGQPGGRLGSARLALIRTGGEGEKSQWLLHRMAPASDRRSVPAKVSRARTPRSTSSDAAESAGVSSIAPMLAEAGTPGLARAFGAPWAEIKWDGIRALGTWHKPDDDDDGRLTLRARSGNDITARYPELTADGTPHLPASDAVVDGEIVAFDAQGRPSFARLQNRMHLTRPREIEREVVRTPIVYLLFDLLRLDGHDLTGMPLRRRRELLEQLASDLDAPVQVPPVFDDLDAALRMSRVHGLEGIVAKNPDSTYRPGARSGSWLKLKNTHTQEVVIVGIRPGQGSRRGGIGSLLLAVPDPADAGTAPPPLRYVGRVGSGFTDRMLRDLEQRLEPLRTEHAPLEGVPALDARDAQWVRAELVGEVEFANWSPGGILRHSRWRGLRFDKTPAEVRVET